MGEAQRAGSLRRRLAAEQEQRDSRQALDAQAMRGLPVTSEIADLVGTGSDACTRNCTREDMHMYVHVPCFVLNSGPEPDPRCPESNHEPIDALNCKQKTHAPHAPTATDRTTLGSLQL